MAEIQGPGGIVPIPFAVPLASRLEYQKRPEIIEKRKRRYFEDLRFVSAADLEQLRRDPTKRQNVCRICGVENLDTIQKTHLEKHEEFWARMEQGQGQGSFPLGASTEDLKVISLEEYRARFHFTKDAALTSPELKAKQQAAIENRGGGAAVARAMRSVREQDPVKAVLAQAQLGHPPRTLEEWFQTQARFRTWSEFAKAVGVSPLQVWHWRKGTYIPDGCARRQRVYELTGIPFGACLEAPWASELWGDLREYAASTRLTPHVRQKRDARTFQALCGLQHSASGPRDVLPSLLFQSAPRGQNQRAKAKITREVLSFIGRFLVGRGFWTAESLEQLAGFLNPLRAQDYRYASSTPAAKHGQKIPLVYDLVVKCGLSNKQVRGLCVADVTAEGIRLSRSRLIHYGDGWHEVPHAHVDEYIQTAEPRADGFLFYQRHPLDFLKPTSGTWMVSAIKAK